jgi:hypothetical protein
MAARRRAPRTCPPEAILAGCDRKVVALANRVRRVVFGMIDGVSEIGHPGRRVIGFRRHGRFAFLQPMADHVRLGFDYGAALPDFGGVLEGRGARVRCVAIRSAAAAASMEVKTLLSAALFDDETHGFRRRQRLSGR